MDISELLLTSLIIFIFIFFYIKLLYYENTTKFILP